MSVSNTAAASSAPPFPVLPIDDNGEYAFGPHRMKGTQLFLLTQLSYASVNLAPVVPGHALVCPRRPVKRVEEMTAEEMTDTSAFVASRRRTVAAAHCLEV